MKVSVVTVAFNAEATIVDTLQSVASQTYQNVEHILIDGASNDGTMELVRKYGTHLARSVSEKDAGIYDAMNKGIALATGEVVAFLNADDEYGDKSVLESVVAAFSVCDLDAVFGDVVLVDPRNQDRVVRRYRSNRFDPRRMGYGWMPAHPALFIKKRVFDEYGGFRTDFRIAGDFDFVARIFKTNELRYQYLPRDLVRMRTGGISTSGWRGTLLLNREVMRACRQNGIDTNWAKLLSKYPAKLREFTWFR